MTVFPINCSYVRNNSIVCKVLQCCCSVLQGVVRTANLFIIFFLCCICVTWLSTQASWMTWLVIHIMRCMSCMSLRVMCVLCAQRGLERSTANSHSWHASSYTCDSYTLYARKEERSTTQYCAQPIHAWCASSYTIHHVVYILCAQRGLARSTAHTYSCVTPRLVIHVLCTQRGVRHSTAHSPFICDMPHLSGHLIRMHTHVICEMTRLARCMHVLLLLVLCHFAGFARPVWGRSKCLPSFLIQSDLCIVYFLYSIL